MGAGSAELELLMPATDSLSTSKWTFAPSFGSSYRGTRPW